MIKILLLISVILPFLLTLQLTPVGATDEVYQLDQSMKVESKSMDPRALVLKDYLAKHNSPMQDNAQDFIDAADTYAVDWKLVPAIAGVESTFGKRIPGGYNAYGWGVYGDNAIYFKSWKDGIFTLNQGLKEKYINRGLTEPYAMNRVYAASPTWGAKVTFFINDIERFAKTHPEYDKLASDALELDSKVAGASAFLNFN